MDFNISIIVSGTNTDISAVVFHLYSLLSYMYASPFLTKRIVK